MNPKPANRIFPDSTGKWEPTLCTEAKIIDNRWLRYEDSDEYQVTIEFEANTINKGVYLQRLKLTIPPALYEKINSADAVLSRYSSEPDTQHDQHMEPAEKIIVRYSRKNPRIALMEGEAGSGQTVDTRQHPAGYLADRPGIDLVAGVGGGILFVLIGFSLFVFDPAIGKLIGIFMIFFGGGIVWYFATEKSRSKAKWESRLSNFLSFSTTTQAKVLTRDITHDQLTIQFDSTGQDSPPVSVTLLIDTDYSISQNLKDSEFVMIRYSPNDPRLALIEGEF